MTRHDGYSCAEVEEQITSLRTRLDSEHHARLEAERRLAEAVEVLKRVEWRMESPATMTARRYCPVCGGWQDKGHGEGCRLARVVRGE